MTRSSAVEHHRNTGRRQTKLTVRLVLQLSLVSRAARAIAAGSRAECVRCTCSDGVASDGGAVVLVLESMARLRRDCRLAGAKPLTCNASCATSTSKVDRSMADWIGRVL